MRTRFGGSEAAPRSPTKADPRSVVAQSRLEEDPRLRVIWNGYAFARDFREERGHAHMLTDQTYTERQLATKQPGTCLHCHASIVVPYTRLGGGDPLPLDLAGARGEPARAPRRERRRPGVPDRVGGHRLGPLRRHHRALELEATTLAGHQHDVRAAAGTLAAIFRRPDPGQPDRP